MTLNPRIGYPVYYCRALDLLGVFSAVLELCLDMKRNRAGAKPQSGPSIPDSPNRIDPGCQPPSFFPGFLVLSSLRKIP